MSAASAGQEPTVVDRGSRYEVLVGDQVAGIVTYHRHDDAIALLHTEIEPEFEGRGLGSVAAHGVLDAARTAGLSVEPYCPFLRRFISRHHEYLDLVDPADRARFDL